MDTNTKLTIDDNGYRVDLILYKIMIGSLVFVKKIIYFSILIIIIQVLH